MIKKSNIVKAAYFANWADNIGFPIAYKLLSIIFPLKFVTPNLVTIISFALYTAGCVSLFLEYTNHLYIAAILLFIGYIGDDLDGILARARGQSSNFGDYLDKVLDVLKIFLITFCLSLAVYLQTKNPYMILLGFVACFSFNYRYYIKLETMFSKINTDEDYLRKSEHKKLELQAKYDKASGIKAFWIRNRSIFFVDEAEFVIIVALSAVASKLEFALWFLAISQVFIVCFRVFERGYQIKSNSLSLIKPLRK